MNLEKAYIPATHPMETVDATHFGEAMPHFLVTTEYTDLSPDEAWTIKHFISGVDEASPYRKLRDYISEYFVDGVYEQQLGARIQVPHDLGKELAGVYTGIYWVVKDEQPELAQNVREKIEAVVQYQSAEVQDFFRKQLAGTLPENSQN